MKHYNLLSCMILLIILYIHIAKSLKSEQIANGIEANQNQFKYQVALFASDALRCGGSILQANAIMLAAHCFININTGKFINSHFFIVASVLNLYNETESKIIDDVVKVFVPKEFKPRNFDPKISHNFQDDVAIAKLKYGLRLFELPHRLSSLNIASLISYVGKILIITGYGFYRTNNIYNSIDYNSTIKDFHYSHGKLRYANVTLLPYEICFEHYRGFNPNNQICGRVEQHSRSHPNDVCAGDNGGPLVYEGKLLVGIVNYIAGKCREDLHAAVYTDVQYYSKFIDGAMNEKNTKQMRIARRRKPFLSSVYQFLED